MFAASVILLVAVSANAMSWEAIVPGMESIDPEYLQEEKPMFSTTGKTFKIKTKDTVVLPCDVINVGHYMQAWKRGIAILTAGSVKVSPDERFRLVEGYNLEIRDVQPQDAGDYVCQIATLQPQEITHTVEILVPPRIHQVSSGGTVEVKKGATVTLECRASGNPVPNITWARKNNVLPDGEKSADGFSITIEETNRHHAGIYQCTANNGVGDPVTRDIQLNILFPPEIEVERSWVHSGEGYEAQLVCIVHAEPPAEVVWYRDTLRLDTTERRIMEVRGSRHTLIIRKVQSSDFGNYSCLADNGIGKTRQYLELSGKPNPAVFRSHHAGRSRDSYNITWTVNSYTPIEEFKLSFRKIPAPSPPGSSTSQQASQSKRPSRRENETGQQHHIYGRGGDWNDVILPAIPSEQFTQHMSYLIRNLEPAGQYEARVQAKNRFGWNEISENFQFTTKGVADPEMRDMSVTSYNNRSFKVSASCFLVIIGSVFGFIRI